MNKLQIKYHEFLDNKIKNENPDCTILVSDFIRHIYIAVIDNKGVISVIIDNIKAPVKIDLPLFTDPNDKYLRFNLRCLKGIPDKVYDFFINNGLFMKTEEPQPGTIAVLHRLIACIKWNIKNMTVNHNDCNPLNNDINNLSVMTQEENINYSLIPPENRAETLDFISHNYQSSSPKAMKLIKDSYKQKAILEFSIKYPDKNPRLYNNKIIKDPKMKVSILKFYFYSKEFLESLPSGKYNLD